MDKNENEFKQNMNAVDVHLSFTNSFIFCFPFCADKPENVTLTRPSCAFSGSVATFTCTAQANPPVHTYRLYENDSMIVNVNGSGVWKRTLNKSGQFNYRCDAINSVATVTSNVNLTVQGELA